MRELKFRAWSGDRFYYLQNSAFTLTYNDISGWNVETNEIRSRYVAGESYSKTPDFILEQYTGLHDKNGVEIYEGDLWERNGFIGQITFRCSQWMIDTVAASKAISYPSFYSNASSGVIIGNIHENPELLQ